MNSNIASQNTNPAYIDLGISFGVRDSTGNLYPNIKEYFLLSKLLQISDLERGFLEAPNKSSSVYQLTVDKNLKDRILAKGEASTIVSFQKRVEGFFAVARLFEASRTNKRGAGND